ncbi:MAG: hypothetical protein MRY32_09490 [Rickettsiales bacterium]|nr:hypothetical protein [Rickettsiales bacterium]
MAETFTTQYAPDVSVFITDHEAASGNKANPIESIINPQGRTYDPAKQAVSLTVCKDGRSFALVDENADAKTKAPLPDPYDARLSASSYRMLQQSQQVCASDAKLPKLSLEGLGKASGFLQRADRLSGNGSTDAKAGGMQFTCAIEIDGKKLEVPDLKALVVPQNPLQTPSSSLMLKMLQTAIDHCPGKGI